LAIVAGGAALGAGAAGAAACVSGAAFVATGGATAADVGGEGGLRAGRNASPTQPAKATADIHVDNRLSVLSTDVKDAMRTCWSNLAETLLRSPLSHHLPSARQKCDLHSSA
jgi:hypothetical protein